MAIICMPFDEAAATSANGCAFTERKEMPNGAGSDWAKLHEESLPLINKGERIEAMKIAKRALQIAEENSGAFHPDVATSLKRIASIHLLTGGDANKAEPLLRRALSIYEKSFGPESLYSADTHYVLSEYYLQKTNYQESERHFLIFADIYLRLSTRTLSIYWPSTIYWLVGLSLRAIFLMHFQCTENLLRSIKDAWGMIAIMWPLTSAVSLAHLKECAHMTMPRST